MSGDRIMNRQLKTGTAMMAVLIGMGVPAAVVGQGIQSSPNQEEQATEQETGVTTMTALELAGAGSDVRAKLSDMIQEPGNQFLEQITIIGRGRGTTAPQGQLGQVVWYGIEATVEEETRRAGLASPLRSSFIVSTAPVPEASELTARGDLAALEEAARKLLADQAGEETGEDASAEEEEEAAGEDDAGGRNNQTSGAGQNDVAGAYDPLDIPEEEETPAPEEPATYEMVTTDGCSPRIVEDQGVVYEQSRIIKVQEGQVIAEGQCSDTLNRFPIQKSYGGCSDSVDLDQMVAHAQYRPYYVDNAGQPQYISDCKPDEEQAFDIVRDGTTCPAVVDIEGGEVFPAFELVYGNRNGVRTVVQGCRPDEESAIPVDYTAAGCGIRHDLPANVSFEQGRAVYYEDGVERVIGQCVDRGEPLPHVIDVAACDPLIDLETETVIPRGKRMIETSIGMQTIVECTPMPDMVQDLVSTTAGCETTFVHNIPAGQSFRTHRYYHEARGSREYATACITDETKVAIPHELQTVDWSHDDERRVSRPVTRSFIMADGERYWVTAPEVLPAAPETPYAFVETREVEDASAKYYEGCSSFIPTALSEIYERAGGTMVEYAIGSGDPVGPENACTALAPASRFYDEWDDGYYGYCRYQVRSINRREDGQMINGPWRLNGREPGPAVFAYKWTEWGDRDEGSQTFYGYVGDSSSGVATGRCYNKLHTSEVVNACSLLGC